MLHNIKELKKFDIIAVDGPIGTVHDFLLDDKEWTIRYLVVDTMKWLPGKKVLISPMTIAELDLVNGNLFLFLTRETIKSSPALETKLPTRAYEASFVHYYGLRPYWYLAEKAAHESVGNQEIEDVVTENYEHESTLRSFLDIEGYHIEATDGRIGHVENFVVCDETWKVRYLVVDTQNWWVGKHVLVDPEWISYVSWQEQIVRVDLTKETIKNGPEYDPNRAITRELEDEIYTKYDKPRFWL
ncbi:PRC-barrel domain containing protein [Anaerobacillus alkaliphilus]|uniref:PRC-barrel domain containing protein n=1 Tax=Anaerobacillus alkaliphilus TaxID=1548597 RepID=A0A4V1LGW2_9BACI|nr:PRC-barrel domain-containing protein [Anaerobacillus alkaliphilus]RXJ04125.1 PRC-barrel domain containing protein [Anaerobacillus alkaliphilus]